MATYSTIAADVEAEQPLVNNAPKRSVKLLIGGAAVAAFVLGALAATAVTSSPGLRGADFSSSSGDLVHLTLSALGRGSGSACTTATATC